MPLSNQERRAQLEQVPLFRDCSPDVLEQSAAATAESAFPADAQLCH